MENMLLFAIISVALPLKMKVARTIYGAVGNRVKRAR